MTSPITIQSVPIDENSSFLRGAAKGPARVREAFFSPSANLYTEFGVDLAAEDGWTFADEAALEENAFDAIYPFTRRLVEAGHRIVSIGGDHSISYPLLRAHAGLAADLTILQLDAHPDLYDSFEGNRFSHACPFARIMEEGLASRLVQMGIRTMTNHQREQAVRFGVQVVDMKDWTLESVDDVAGPVYISLDLDVLDPAYAPGVSHHEPGGFSTRNVLDIIHRLPGPIIGADIVELNPTRDWMGMTAMAAAKCLKEILGRMISSG